MLSKEQKIEKIALIVKYSDIIMESFEEERDESLKNNRFEGEEELLNLYYKKILTSVYRIRNNAAALLLRNNCGCSVSDDNSKLYINVDGKLCEFSVPTIKNSLQADFERVFEKNRLKASSQVETLDMARIVPGSKNEASDFKRKENTLLANKDLNIEKAVAYNGNIIKPINTNAQVGTRSTNDKNQKRAKLNLTENDKGDGSLVSNKSSISEDEFWTFGDDDFNLANPEQIIPIKSDAKLEAKIDLPHSNSGSYQKEVPVPDFAPSSDEKAVKAPIPNPKKDNDPDFELFDDIGLRFNNEQSDKKLLKVPLTIKEKDEEKSEDKDGLAVNDKGRQKGIKRSPVDESENPGRSDNNIQETPISKDDFSEDRKGTTPKIEKTEIVHLAHEQTLFGTSGEGQENKFRLNPLAPDPEVQEENLGTEAIPLIFNPAPVDLAPEDMLKKLQRQAEKRKQEMFDRQIEEETKQPITTGVVFDMKTGKKQQGEIDVKAAADKIDKVAKGILETQKNDLVMDEKVKRIGNNETKGKYGIQKESDFVRGKEQFILDDYSINVEIKGEKEDDSRQETAHLKVFPLKIPETGNALVTDIAACLTCKGETHVRAVSPGGKTTILMKMDEFAILVRGSWEGGRFVSSISVIGAGGYTAKYEYEKMEVRPDNTKECGIGHNVIYLDHATTAHIMPYIMENNLYDGEFVDFIAVIIRNYGEEQDCECLFSATNAEMKVNGERYKFNLITKWDNEEYKLKLTTN